MRNCQSISQGVLMGHKRKDSSNLPLQSGKGSSMTKLTNGQDSDEVKLPKNSEILGGNITDNKNQGMEIEYASPIA